MEPLANNWPWALRPRKRAARSPEVEIIRVTRSSSKKLRAIRCPSSEMTFLTLPLDVQLEILRYLGPRDLLVLQKVCKQLETLLQTRTIWKAYEIWDNEMPTADVVEDLKRMPLLRSITIRNRQYCDLIIRQISVSNKRLEHLVLIDCAGGPQTNLVSGYLTRLLERCVKLRSVRIEGSHFSGVKFYRILGAAIPRLREFHVSSISYTQLVAFMRQLENRIVVKSPGYPYILKFETYFECILQMFRSSIVTLCSSFDFVVEKQDTVLALYQGYCAPLRMQLKDESAEKASEAKN